MMVKIAPLDLNAKYVNAEIVTEYDTVMIPMCRYTGNGCVVITDVLHYTGKENMCYTHMEKLDTNLYLLYNTLYSKYDNNIEATLYIYKGNGYYLTKRD